MKKKTILVTTCALMLTVSTLAVTLNNNLLLNKADKQIYTLSLNTPLSIINNSAHVNTRLGNPVDFSTTGFTGGKENEVMNLTNGAFFKNATILNSIKSIDILYSSGSLLLAYDYDEIDVDTANYISTESPLHVEFTDCVNYFAIKATEYTTINSFSITYECQKGTRPSSSIDLPLPTITKEPSPVANLYYDDGNDLTLVNPGELSGGTFMYAIGNGEFSSELPKASEVGKYEIRYYAKGDGSHSDTKIRSFAADIRKVTTITPVADIDFKYYSNSQYVDIFNFAQGDPIKDLEYSKVDEGLLLTATSYSTDPHITMHIEKMFEYMGYPLKNDTYVPFDCNNVKSFVIKYKFAYDSLFQFYFTAGSQTTLYEPYSYKTNLKATSDFYYLPIDLSNTSTWSGKLNDMFRFDPSMNMPNGSKFYVSEIAFFENGSDAQAYADENNRKDSTVAYELDFTKFSDTQIKDAFIYGTNCNVTKDTTYNQGVVFTSKADNNTDPFHGVSLEKAFEFAGATKGKKVADSFIPFTTNEVKSVAIELAYQYSDEFQLFYCCNQTASPSEAYSIKKPFGKCDIGTTELIPFDLTVNDNWEGNVNDCLRFDFGRSMYKNEPFYIKGLYFFAKPDGAAMYSQIVNNGDKSYYRDPRHYEELKPMPEGYYVCLFEESLGGLFTQETFATKEAAINYIQTTSTVVTNDNAAWRGQGNWANAQGKANGGSPIGLSVLGYRVANEKGEFVAGPNNYSKLQCDILREGNWVARYTSNNRFYYTNAPLNPAINDRAKIFSCDRTVCWILYRVGFVHQPFTSGICINWVTDKTYGNLKDWCVNYNGFDDVSSGGWQGIKAGDVIEVKYANDSSSDPVSHTYIAASDSNGVNAAFRYDGGAVFALTNSPEYALLDSFQSSGIGRVVYVLRPKVTASNNVFANEYIK